MSDITISNNSQQALSLLLSWGIPVIVFLFFTILTFIMGPEALARVRVAARKTRKYLDEPTDPAIQLLHTLVEKIGKSEIDERQLIALIDKVLDEAAKTPPQEVNIGDTAK